MGISGIADCFAFFLARLDDRISAIEAGGGANYRQQITAANLSVAGLLPVTHNLGVIPSCVVVWDENGYLIELLDYIQVINVNTIVINFSSFLPLTGTWQLVVGG